MYTCDDMLVWQPYPNWLWVYGWVPSPWMCCVCHSHSYGIRISVQDVWSWNHVVKLCTHGTFLTISIFIRSSLQVLTHPIAAGADSKDHMLHTHNNDRRIATGGLSMLLFAWRSVWWLDMCVRVFAIGSASWNWDSLWCSVLAHTTPSTPTSKEGPHRIQSRSKVNCSPTT